MAVVFLAVLQGCVVGGVTDASNGGALNGVTVTVINGTCQKPDGSTCASLSQTTRSISGLGNSFLGSYAFDFYGNVNGSANVQQLGAASGQEAIGLRFSRLGYQTVTVWHRPKYNTVTDSGKGYFYTLVPTVMLCRTGSPDSDADGLCDQAEARLGTNPSDADTDRDRIPDLAEVYGANNMDMVYYGANPRRRDVFVEIDYYPNLKPDQDALNDVQRAFLSAPLTNHDGTTGIQYHAAVDQQIGDADVDSDLNPVWTDFDVIKGKYFPPRRARYFHYALVANQYNGGTSSGRSRGYPGHDLVVTMGNWSIPGGTRQEQAGTHMHEFGHNLGLMHGGDEEQNHKVNYLSIMSYNYQLPGLTVRGTPGVLDYSRLTIASIAEGSVSESAGLTPVSPTTESDLSAYSVALGELFRSGNASAELDFNGNGRTDPGTIRVDLNNDGDGVDTLRPSQNDWAVLDFGGAGTIGASAVAGLSAGSGFKRAPEAVENCIERPSR